MEEQEAFVYCWTDHKCNMLYIGSHKGTPDDGYVCSSKYMMAEYEKRPQDFTREIIAFGLEEDIRALERNMLKSVDAARDFGFYNRSNGRAGFVFGLEGEKNPNYGGLSEEHIENLSKAHIGQTAWNKGLSMSDEFRKNVSKAKKGQTSGFKNKNHTEKSKQQMSKSHKKRFGGKKENHPMYNRNHSEETKKKQSKAKKGKESPFKNKNHTEEAKRKNAEKHKKPNPERDEAREKGENKYMPDHECKNGHMAERYVRDNRCVECQKGQNKRKWEKHGDELLERQNEHRRKNADEINARRRERRRNNKEGK